jgi:hypothetical protein
LLEGGQAFGEKEIREIHFDVVEDALGTLVGKLDLADGFFGSFHEPVVEGGFLLVEVLAREVFLDADELEVLLAYVVAENVDGDLEVDGVYLSIHLLI